MRWRATGTFLGPGRFQGFAPNGARIAIEGCDVVEVVDDLIVANDAYVDSGDVARQLGFLPPPAPRPKAAWRRWPTPAPWLGSALYGAEPEAIAAGVWILRGGRPRAMNVYLIEDEGGVTVFDAGVAADEPRDHGRRRALRRDPAGRARPRRLRPPRRRRRARRPDLLPPARALGGAVPVALPRLLEPQPARALGAPGRTRGCWRIWDGGALEVAGTVEEGDEIAGFKVLHLPGHAPGLIGLFREEDGLALVSDCLYTLNPETGLGQGGAASRTRPQLRHQPGARIDPPLAALGPKVVWPGHAKPVAGDDVELQLQRAASAAV